MMILVVRVINAKRIFLCCYVVTKCKVKLIGVVDLSCNRCNRVVLFAVGFRKYKCRFVRVGSPLFKNYIRKLDNSVAVLAAKSDNRKRPFNYARFNILKALDCKMLFNRCFCHCKGIMTALIMVVREDRAADNRQICI